MTLADTDARLFVTLCGQTAGKVAEFQTACAAQGVDVLIVQARRTRAEQAALYAQGRNGDTRPVVTQAPPGTTFHEKGRAADLAPYRDGRVSWADDDPAWGVMAENARLVRLHSGSEFRSFKDRPHVEDRWCATCAREHVAPDDLVRGGVAHLAETFKDDGTCALPKRIVAI